MKRSYKEKLTMQQIRNKIIYTGEDNQHLKKFYDIRKNLVGSANKQVKLISSDLESDGSALFIFQTVVTPYEDIDHEYFELENDRGKLKKNIGKEYLMELRLVDFFSLADELEMLDSYFSKEDLSAIIDLSQDVQFSCTCPSFYYMGGAYWSTQQQASLIKCNIKPQYWDSKELRGETLICKHLSALLRNLSFLENQMAMSIKKNMKEQGLI